MSTVTELIEAVKSLSAEEKDELLSRLGDVDFNIGDRTSSLQETMNTISENAKNRGLTPETLDSTLRKK
jgi:hypothetical protein